MTREQIDNRVKEIISYLTKTDPIFLNDGSNPYADFGIDSLDFTEIKFEIEKEYGIDLKNDITEDSSVKEIVDAVVDAINRSK